MHRLWCLVVIGALAVAVSVVGAGPAFAAKGGNSDNAKLCQKGAWQALVSNTGGEFANQGDCVSPPGSAPFGAAGQAACNGIGGGFELRTRPLAWNCRYVAPPLPTNPPELQAACATDAPTGMLETEQIDADLWVGICIP
jgi:hypothetical protein